MTKGSQRSALSRFPEPLVERVTRATHGTDGIGCTPAVERAAQPADMHVDGALVDIDVAAPNAVEQLLARIDAAGVLHQEFEQAELGRPEMHLAARARYALFLAIEFQIAGPEHGRDPLGLRSAQQRA